MADECAEVDTDLLGLGVRLGVYLQLVAVVILVVTGGHGTLPGHGEAASVTLAAILGVLMVRLAEGKVHAAEFLCVLFVAAIQALVAFLGVLAAQPFDTTAAKGSLYPWRVPCASLRHDATLHTGRRLIPGFNESNGWHVYEAMRLDAATRSQRRFQRSLTLQIGVLFASGVITVWFWQSGYEGLQRVSCDTVWTSFYFARVRAFGWVRYLILVVSYMTVIMYGMMLLPRLVAGLRCETDPPVSILAQTPPQLEACVDVQRVSATEEAAKLLAVSRNKSALSIFLFLMVAYVGAGVSFVEMGMHYNGFRSDTINLQGLSNTGQMLSVLVGVALVLSSLHAPVAPCPMWESCIRFMAALAEPAVEPDAFTQLCEELKRRGDQELGQMQQEGGAGTP